MIPDYDGCIWAVEPERRQCEFCVYRECELREKEEQARREQERRIESYVEIMSQILGIDIKARCKEHDYVWGRNIVAYQMLKDGLRHRVIAGYLGIDRSSIFHIAKRVEMMLQYPKSYSKEMKIWRRFQELTYLHKQ
jgi:hypothetical protein